MALTTADETDAFHKVGLALFSLLPFAKSELFTKYLFNPAAPSFIAFTSTGINDTTSEVEKTGKVNLFILR